MKKTLSVLLTVVFIISMLPMSVIAAESRKIEVTGLSEEFIYNDDGSYYSIPLMTMVTSSLKKMINKRSQPLGLILLLSRRNQHQ